MSDEVSVDPKVVGERVRALREANGPRTQKALAERLGVTPQTMWRIENGVNCPSRDLLATIASIYCVSVDHLLGREDPGRREAEAVFRELKANPDLRYAFEALREMTPAQCRAWAEAIRSVMPQRT